MTTIPRKEYLICVPFEGGEDGHYVGTLARTKKIVEAEKLPNPDNKAIEVYEVRSGLVAKFHKGKWVDLHLPTTTVIPGLGGLPTIYRDDVERLVQQLRGDARYFEREAKKQPLRTNKKGAPTLRNQRIIARGQAHSLRVAIMLIESNLLKDDDDED